MGSTLKGKNLLLGGANSCLNELTPLRRDKNETACSRLIVSRFLDFEI